ncbi:PAS domain-containing protein [Mesorhizobium sp. BR1-1-16]|uniref:CheR family methyltransferase n=1 Tax=Mesorhizobium sp. BR1-1-16 TaxID=2876653 RepID=UPI001CC95261|nr:CheR family methyltransferase [Mesorhizobium sp. BR1-1-16]MBZ9936972.1 PAS domain-containing protein [Mesorhizobium sp. BR1-1-16]
MTDSDNRFPVVGIGASAGGIPAMEAFFRGLPVNPGAAFVIVTHLNPEHHSVLHEVIGRYTELPVVVAEDATVVELDHVYVMPPNAILTMAEGILQLRRPNSPGRERKPIDIFLSSLAADQSEYAVAVILSGGDGDGTLGAKAIKERGGLTLAQASDASGPRNPDMPESAISSGMIDLAVPAEEMGEKIVAFVRSFHALAVLTETKNKSEEAALQSARGQIYSILNSQTGHDFSGYKTKTFMRRVRRRMQVLQLGSLEDYVDLLGQDASEVANLFRDLLINVTNFFRDPEAFALLEKEVVPKLFEGRSSNDAVRIWVPGCATGEEVYSLAILMREHLDRTSNPPRVQIFATDIDEHALGIARSGRYPEQLTESLSPERRQRFFHRDGSSFTVTSELRELCVFSPHSVIRDPPFSRMDMVSCRNLLIYFGPDIQNRVMPTFHYALKPGGYLFLGTSESIGHHTELFTTIEKKNRIFQARERLSSPPQLSALLAEPRLAAHEDASGLKRRHSASPLRQVVEMQVLERFSPAHVVVNGEGEVVYYSSRTGRFLEAAQGAPSRQILSMAKKGLRLDLRAALRQAVETKATAIRKNVVLDGETEQSQQIDLTVEPLSDRSMQEPLFLVLFEPSGQPVMQAASEGRAEMPDGSDDLERELRDTRERLQSTIEEYETALEELKSSNEELVSVNEEAQSTNEELEASKEEMQSLNEELNTINTELISKVEDLDRANSDLKNLFESTKIATVFLDRNLVIRNFTPAASTFFHLRSSDVGRPLTDLSSNLDYPDLRDAIETVFRTGEMLEHQLPRDSNGKHFLIRLIPYRDDVGRTGGVVVTLVDVSTLAAAEEHQQVLISELNHRVKNMLAVVISIANHTLESAPSPEEFSNSLIGRLHAMARAYGLLSRTNWKTASVKELVEQEAAAFDAARFQAVGPDLRLEPQYGLPIGMVIHELATNAAKYGALSKNGGTVDIRWELDGPRLKLIWAEKDGPPVVAPDRNGFGLSLVKGEIEYRLRGTVETFFDPDGLKVHMSFDI